MLNIINHNGTTIVGSFNTRRTKPEVDTLISASYDQTETGNMLNQKVNTSVNRFIQDSLTVYSLRCGQLSA